MINPFKKTTIQELINKDIFESEVALLDFQSKLEYYQTMVVTTVNRINRLRSYNEKNLNWSGPHHNHNPTPHPPTN